MKISNGIGLGALITLASAAAWLGCSSSDSTDGTPTSDAGSSPDASGTANDSGPLADAGSSTDTGSAIDTGTPATPTCAAYCTSIMQNCTGANQQYLDNATCLRACAVMPLGTGSDDSGNTVGCRITHAGFAAATPTPHCWHAGPYGYGACGDTCTNFCAIAMSYCSADAGVTPPYDSNADCMTACAGYTAIDTAATVGVDGGFNANGPGDGDTLDCRAYHLDNALQSDDNQMTHCPHAASDSPVCQ